MEIEDARRMEIPKTTKERVAKKQPRTERSDSEMDTEALSITIRAQNGTYDEHLLNRLR